MRRAFNLLLVGLLPALAAVPGRGFAQDEPARVVLAAISAVRPSIGSGRAAVDASALCTADLAQWRCPEGVREHLARLRLVPGSPEFMHVCPAGPVSCRLAGVRHFVTPGTPRISGRSARVTIEVVSAPAGEANLVTRRHSVHLSRQSRGWEVVRVDSPR